MTASGSGDVPASITRGLNDAQQQAVTTLDGPMLVIAGPGAGKTRVLTRRVAALAATGTDAANILALTFTNKAANEMRQRVVKLLGPAGTDPWLLTFHAFSLRLLRAAPEAGGLKAGFVVLGAGDAWRLMRDIVRTAGGDVDDTGKVLSRISYLRSRMSDRSGLEDTKLDRLVGDVWETYTHTVEAMGAVDFDGLLERGLKAIQINDIRDRISNRFTHIMVDEFQDTNRIQFEMIRRIADAHQQIAVVGDGRQAIYGWRGASSEALDWFIDAYPAARIVRLEENFRSTPQILNVVQHVGDLDPGRFSTKLFTRRADGPKVRIVAAGDTDDEAGWIVRDLKTRDGTIGILVRTNAQTRPFEAALAGAGIGYQVVGTQSFKDRKEITAALAWLRAVTRQGDVDALTQAASVPRRRIGPGAVNQLVEASNRAGVTPVEGVGDLGVLGQIGGAARDRLVDFGKAVTAVAAAAQKGPEAAIRAILETAGVRAWYETRNEEDRVENLDSLMEAATTFTATTGANGIKGCRLFYEQLTLSGPADTAETQPVSVVTVHASKGREFDHVYVAGAENGLFPHRLSVDDDATAEERRLFFVAVSRARQSLTITHRSRRFFFGRWENSSPSPYLRNLRLAGCEQVRTSGARSTPQRRRSTPKRRYDNDRLSASERDWVEPVVRPKPVVQVAGIGDGSRVVHAAFGAGTVIEATEAELRVLFDDGSEKLLSKTWAPLTLET